MLRVLATLVAVVPTAAAPAPKEPPRPTVTVLKAAVGKSHVGKEVRAVGRAMGEDPVIRYELWHRAAPGDAEDLFFNLRWKAKGLELYFDRGTLHTARMYNDKVDGFGRYVGELPEGLAFDDTPAAVEKKLGKPDVVLRVPPEDAPDKPAAVRTDVVYKEKGVGVSFRKPVGGEAVITSVAVFPPGDAPAW